MEGRAPGGFIRGILRGVTCTKSLRVLVIHRRSRPEAVFMNIQYR
jgi:hypothetical protein